MRGANNVKFWILNRLINPFVKAVLRSPVHGLLSGSLVLLTYRGQRTGQRHSLPVMYAQQQAELIVFAAWPREKTWWRNLLAAAPVDVILRGRRHSATAEAVLENEGAWRTAWDSYISKFPKAALARKQGDDPVFVRITLA